MFLQCFCTHVLHNFQLCVNRLNEGYSGIPSECRYTGIRYKMIFTVNFFSLIEVKADEIVFFERGQIFVGP